MLAGEKELDFRPSGTRLGLFRYLPYICSVIRPCCKAGDTKTRQTILERITTGLPYCAHHSALHCSRWCAFITMTLTIEKPSEPRALILEAWAQGFMTGALIIMSAITIANMRRKVLLHKLILVEVSLLLHPCFECFKSFRSLSVLFCVSTAA